MMMEKRYLKLSEGMGRECLSMRVCECASRFELRDGSCMLSKRNTDFYGGHGKENGDL